MEKITKYEEARLLGSRALQLSMGAPILVKLSEEDLMKIKYNPIEIAKLELAADVIPMAVKKALPKRRVVEEPEAA
ncbi:MAG: DNA-directed RNA polymerase subunit K [Candidatus Woesearchaeota archaeon]|jgi:DNA-directed RNA polymerase subunit K/omega|nr:DNA-directed RNA polymerase subunit K [Candidatus Woesearchaeota archaeon]